LPSESTAIRPLVEFQFGELETLTPATAGLPKKEKKTKQKIKKETVLDRKFMPPSLMGIDLRSLPRGATIVHAPQGGKSFFRLLSSFRKFQIDIRVHSDRRQSPQPMIRERELLSSPYGLILPPPG